MSCSLLQEERDTVVPSVTQQLIFFIKYWSPTTSDVGSIVSKVLIEIATDDVIHLAQDNIEHSAVQYSIV